MNKICLILILVAFQNSVAQIRQDFRSGYHFLTSGNLVGDKNFYLLTVLEQTPAIRKIISRDSVLQQYYVSKVDVFINDDIEDISDQPVEWPRRLSYAYQDSAIISNSLSVLYDEHRATFDKMIEKHLRQSGYFQRFSDDNNKTLLLQAWAQVFTSSNNIIDKYGFQNRLNSNFVYPSNRHYRDSFKSIFTSLAVQDMHNTRLLFFKPALSLVNRLLEINGHNEAARHEPLEKGINEAAFKEIPGINWEGYPYSVILILGSGPEDSVTALSQTGKLRCDTAVLRYKLALAPFIVVSGGYVHPAGTHFCEALEMKKYLITQYAIPEAAIISEPFARHTTTNIRNTNRVIYRYGIPADKPVLVISTQWHIGSITDTSHSFDNRNLRELGYLPYKNMTRKAPSEATYLPAIISLQMDPGDPLDP